MTLRAWERLGKFPKTYFIVGNGIRLYPRRLVERLYAQFVKWHETSFHWSDATIKKVHQIFDEESTPLVILIQSKMKSKMK
jgi:DNA-binding transcriptional MerR regulator